MCFLSVYRLKYLISIGIVVTLLIGISLLYVLVYSFIISSVTIQVRSEFRTVLIAIFLCTSLLMILSSLSGIYGTLALTQDSSERRTNLSSSMPPPWPSTWSPSWSSVSEPPPPPNTSPSNARTPPTAPTKPPHRPPMPSSASPIVLATIQTQTTTLPSV